MAKLSLIASVSRIAHRQPKSVVSVLGARLPSAAVYEREYLYWPWGKLIELATSWLVECLPSGARLIDYMCGTGYLINEVHNRRPDLLVMGCDNNKSFIHYAKKHYAHLALFEADARRFHPNGSLSAIVCTAGLHHLKYSDQSTFIAKIASELPENGYLILGEELIGKHITLQERNKEVVRLSTALLEYIIDMDADRDVIKAAVDVLMNDLLERGEYKFSQPQLEDMLQQFFVIEKVHRVWPVSDMGFGDYLFVCRKRREKLKCE